MRRKILSIETLCKGDFIAIDLDIVSNFHIAHVLGVGCSNISIISFETLDTSLIVKL